MSNNKVHDFNLA